MKKKNIFSNIIGIFLIASSVIFLMMIFKMKIIPTKYLAILLYTYIPFVLINLIFLLNKNIKKIIKIFSGIFSIVIIIASLYISFNMFKTIEFINNTIEKDYHLENYYIVVLKDSKYDKIENIKNKEVGIYKNSNVTEEAIKELNKTNKFIEKNYTNFISLGQDLLDKKIEFLLSNESYLNVMNDDIDSFESNTRKIDKISLKVKNEVEKKEVNVVEEPFNIYISGIDIYDNISSVSRSDVNMVVTVNPLTNKIAITAIPRDYYVQLSGTKGYRDKLTHAGLYGVDMSIKTIEELLETNINYYVRVNFSTIINTVDVVGGIDVDSDYTFTAQSGEKFKKGINQINGKEALAFSRERYAFLAGDRQRIKNQQKVVNALINKTINSKTLLTKYSSILKAMKSSFQTNIDSKKIYQLVNMQLDKMPSWEVKNINLDGYDSNNYTYSNSKVTAYVMEPDMKTVNNARETIKNVMNIK